MFRNCDICGKEFEYFAWDTKRRFCNRLCAGKYAQKRREFIRLKRWIEATEKSGLVCNCGFVTKLLAKAEEIERK